MSEAERATMENTIVNSRYDITIAEMLELKAIDDIYEMIYTAFKLGYGRGTRAEKARAKREKSTRK